MIGFVCFAIPFPTSPRGYACYERRGPDAPLLFPCFFSIPEHRIGIGGDDLTGLSEELASGHARSRAAQSRTGRSPV
ncbi:hypothetical protein IB211_01359c [Intestinimonas butyriciproducens]|uniref:Uncharacterized protein n=1 Tax=Intestinimonas butyriciproducens TaxID=1297617 RepID=A0A0S2W307_9FIRM|nr:hypothetical protein IB211_01359c [Intestinimonas butyriciproducens]